MQFDQRLTRQFADQPEAVQHGLHVKVTVLHLVSLNTQAMQLHSLVTLVQFVANYHNHVPKLCV